MNRSFVNDLAEIKQSSIDDPQERRVLGEIVEFA